MKTSEAQAIHPAGKLLFLGIAAGLGLIYASLIPLQYEPLGWEETIDRFRGIRWLNLNVYRRADWVANGLAVLPFGFLLSGAADRDHKLSVRYMIQILGIMFSGILLVVGIEFVQLWFPPRTVSGNDIAAGCVGSLIGPLLWPVIGRACLAQWTRLKHLPKAELLSPKTSRVLLVLYSGLLITYSIMPLDLMFSMDEWQIKSQQGRFAWLTGIGINASNNFAGLLELTATLALSSLRMIPFGVLAYRSKLTKLAPIFVIGFPILLEVLQAPIFTRYTTFIDVLCGWTGGLLGLLLTANWFRVIRLNQSKSFRVMLVMACVLLIELAFLGRYERACTTEEITSNWKFFWAPPFSKYYYTTEFLAASNFAGKALAFAVLGFLVGNLRHHQPLSAKNGKQMQTIICAGVIVIVALCVELPQIYLQAFIADASDILIYLAGATIGWMSHDFLINRKTSNTQILPKQLSA